MAVYLEGPDNLTALVISVIENGKVRGVDMPGTESMAEMKTAYKQRTFQEFATQFLEPAFSQLFDEGEQDGNGTASGQ